MKPSPYVEFVIIVAIICLIIGGSAYTIYRLFSSMPNEGTAELAEQ